MEIDLVHQKRGWAKAGEDRWSVTVNGRRLVAMRSDQPFASFGFTAHALWEVWEDRADGIEPMSRGHSLDVNDAMRHAWDQAFPSFSWGRF